MTGTSAAENLTDLKGFVYLLAQGKPDGFIIMDIGAGQGLYYNVLHDIPGVQMEAIEVWEPSVEAFKLREKYAFVWSIDVRNLPDMAYAQTDMVIMGDVLEHLPVEDAVKVFMQAYNSGAWVVVSVPNSHYPQGAIDGNHYEEHLILDPPKELIPHLPTAEVFWDYPVTNTYIYKNREVILQKERESE
jgi:2-polyprenyl-3-methyl-5-hydroxy-6-metoxy-1,4-benzoquinol methylase